MKEIIKTKKTRKKRRIIYNKPLFFKIESKNAIDFALNTTRTLKRPNCKRKSFKVKVIYIMQTGEGALKAPKRNFRKSIN
ncbi:MAG: hypothetical protein LLG13_12855 [Bacteroidales bacterium]|nr:hypothetical protein [Bacteroidales bacterium]